MRNDYIKGVTKTKNVAARPLSRRHRHPADFATWRRRTRSYVHKFPLGLFQTQRSLQNTCYRAVFTMFSNQNCYLFVRNHRIVYERFDFAYSSSAMNDSLSKFVYMNSSFEHVGLGLLCMTRLNSMSLVIILNWLCLHRIAIHFTFVINSGCADQYCFQRKIFQYDLSVSASYYQLENVQAFDPKRLQTGSHFAAHSHPRSCTPLTQAVAHTVLSH